MERPSKYVFINNSKVSWFQDLTEWEDTLLVLAKMKYEMVATESFLKNLDSPLYPQNNLIPDHSIWKPWFILTTPDAPKNSEPPAWEPPPGFSWKWDSRQTPALDMAFFLVAETLLSRSKDFQKGKINYSDEQINLLAYTLARKKSWTNTKLPEKLNKILTIIQSDHLKKEHRLLLTQAWVAPCLFKEFDTPEKKKTHKEQRTFDSKLTASQLAYILEGSQKKWDRPINQKQLSLCFFVNALGKQQLLETLESFRHTGFIESNSRDNSMEPLLKNLLEFQISNSVPTSTFSIKPSRF